jgi:hypothetical protein
MLSGASAPAAVMGTFRIFTIKYLVHFSKSNLIDKQIEPLDILIGVGMLYNMCLNIYRSFPT